MPNIRIKLSEETLKIIAEIPRRFDLDTRALQNDSHEVELELLSQYLDQPVGCSLIKMSTDPRTSSINDIKKQFSVHNGFICYDNKLFYTDNQSIVPVIETEVNQNARLSLLESFSSMENDSHRLAQPKELELITIIAELPKEGLSLSSKKLKFKNEKLRTSLLKDISTYFKLANNHEVAEDKKLGPKFWSLAGAGALFFACEGFDGIISIFGLFSVSPLIAALVAGAFAVLAVMVFWGFELKQIGENLGVDIKNTSDQIEQYVQQVHEIEIILQEIEHFLNKHKPLLDDDLDEQVRILGILHIRLSQLRLEKEKIDQSRGAPWVKGTKTAIALVTGILFFSSGFFTGQAVALFIAGFFVTASATFPPILVAASVVALLALWLYWSCQKPSIDKLIGRKLGLDHENLEELGTKKTGEIEGNIETLKSTIADKKALLKGEREKIESQRTLIEQGNKLQSYQLLIDEQRSQIDIVRAELEAQRVAYQQADTTVGKLTENISELKEKLADQAVIAQTNLKIASLTGVNDDILVDLFPTSVSCHPKSFVYPKDLDLNGSPLEPIKVTPSSAAPPQKLAEMEIGTRPLSSSFDPVPLESAPISSIWSSGSKSVLFTSREEVKSDMADLIDLTTSLPIRDTTPTVA